MSKKQVKEKIHAKGIDIVIYTENFKDEFISMTDIAKYKSDEPSAVVANWIRNKDVLEFLGLWESLHNDDFNPLEFEEVKTEAGSNAFTLSPKKWIEATNAKGIVSKAGRYGGGTYAHSDIALEFASWISAEFKLYIIKDYKRLKSDESSKLSVDWNVKRELSKINYQIQTDAIKTYIIPSLVTKNQIGYAYASEADILNVALFGQTASEWKRRNINVEGNLRDEATLNQLLVLANMESYNAILIEQKLSQADRIQLLNNLAISQMQTLEDISKKELIKLRKNDDNILF